MSAESVLYTVLMKKLDQQYAAIVALDDKIAKVFGFASAVLPIYAALVVSERNILNTKWVLLTGIPGGVVYIVLMVLLYRGFQSGDWDWRPNRDVLRQRSQLPGATEASEQLWVSDQIIVSLRENDDMLKVKGASVNLSLFLLPVEVVVLAISALVSVF